MLQGLNKQKSFEILQGWEQAIKDNNIFGFGLSKMLYYRSPSVRIYDEHFTLKGIFDNDNQLWNKTILGYNILSPQRISDINNGKIVIFAGDYVSIRKQLEGYGLKEKQDFIFVLDFWPVWCFYKYDKLYCSNNVISFITDRCNLHCKECVSSIPYIKNPFGDVPLEQLKQNMDVFFEYIDECFSYGFSGGEPLTYKQMPALLTYAGEKYGHRTASLTCITNGSLEPESEIIEIWKKYRYKVTISNYSGVGIPGYEENFKKLVQILENKCINYFISTQPWYARNISQQALQALADTTTEELIFRYANCTNRNSTIVKGGYYYQCNRGFLTEQHLEQQDTLTDSLYLPDLSPDRKEDRLTILMHLLFWSDPGPTLKMCETCVGCAPFSLPVSVSVPRAIQLKRADL